LNFIKQYKIQIAAIIGIVLLAVSLLVDTVQTISPNIHRAKKLIEKRLHSLEKNAETIINSTELIHVDDNYEKARAIIQKLDANKNIQFYIYKDDALVYWSTNAFIPENIDKLSEHEIHFLKEGNGFYEVKHTESKDGRFNLYALIPVYYQYAIANKFLQNGFVWNHPFLKRFIISNKEVNKTISITNNNGNYLFSIRVADNAQFVYNPYVVIIEFIGLLILFWSMYQIVKQNILRKNFKISFAIIFFICVLTDLLFNQFKLFSLTKTSLLFSSNLYASAYLGDTLGTLLIRTFLFSWSLSFLRFIDLNAIKIKNKNWLLIFPVIVYYVLIFIIQSVIQNSVISFNFYLVNTLDKYTLISLVIFGLSFSCLLFLMNWIFDQTISNKFFVYVIVFSIVGLSIGYFIGEFTDIVYSVFLLLWLLTFFLFFYYEKSFFQNNRKYRFLSNLILLSFIAFLTSVIVIFNTTKKDAEKRKYRMQELVSERDIGEEYTLMESEKFILQDNFIKSYFKNPYLSTLDLDKRINAKYFKPLTKRYNIITYTFDKDGFPLIGVSQKEFYKLNNIRFAKKVKSTSANFYYLSIKENGEKYLGYFPIKEDDTTNLGYLFVEFIPKIFNSYSAYPELLLKQKNYYDEEFDNFSYGIYDNKYLVKQKGDYEYQVSFNFPVNKHKEINQFKSNGYDHTIYFSNDKQVVLSEKNRPALSTLSVFSYMVIFFLFFFIFIDLIGFSNRFWGEDSIKNFFSGNTLQKQIQNSMIALVLFSLAVIGLVTMVYFQYQYNIYHNSRLLKKVNAVMKNVSQYYVEDFSVYGENTFDKVIQQKIKVLSNIHALDINVYNTKGDLLQSSQGEIFKRNLVSLKIDENAYYNLIIKSKSKYVHDEKLGN
jgi:hypothetical protein